MNQILAYLERCRERECDDLFRHSANYAMTRPREGHEKEFAAALLDCEIVDELIALFKRKPVLSQSIATQLSGTVDIDVSYSNSTATTTKERR